MGTEHAPELVDRAGRIRAVALDVDGVLTDGTFWWGPDGEEWKRFSFRDVMGISLARKAGIIFALISGEDTPQVTRFAAKMQIAHVFVGCRDKAAALRQFARDAGVSLDETAVVGDDVNDVAAMGLCGLATAPADAHSSARDVAHLVTTQVGGNGAVREFVDFILACGAMSQAAP